MTISDETLMAYLDNELSPEERAQVGAAIASDPNVKARLERQARVHAMAAPTCARSSGESSLSK